MIKKQGAFCSISFLATLAAQALHYINQNHSKSAGMEFLETVI
jgi:hypothetical protein